MTDSPDDLPCLADKQQVIRKGAVVRCHNDHLMAICTRDRGMLDTVSNWDFAFVEGQNSWLICSLCGTPAIYNRTPMSREDIARVALGVYLD